MAEGDIVIALSADDETWEINLTRDLTGRDWLAMERHRPDVSFASVCNAVIVKQVTVLALVLWAYRRHDEPDLDYEAVLDALSAASVGEFRISEGEAPKKGKGKGGKKESERPS